MKIRKQNLFGNKGIDLDFMNYLEFLDFVEKVETGQAEEGSISIHVIVGE